MSRTLLEIVHHDFCANALEHFLNEIDVRRMHLVIVLRFLVREDQIESDLIGLIDHRSVARRHSANVIVKNAGNPFKISIRAFDQFISGFGILRIGPEYNDVGEHSDFLRQQSKLRGSLES